ncbi:MAG TPA: PAS domain S-box protein, partial [Bacteroidia bacterium]|nr:PAS domain S-box protein [Bacteroidia bacterium]
LSRSLFEYLHPADIETARKEWIKLNNGGKTVGFETRYRTKSGEIKLIRWVANPNTQTKEIFAIGRYDADRERWEQELLLSEQKHRTFFENSQGLMCLHDMKGNFIDVNPAGAVSIGYSTDELHGKSLFDIVPADGKVMLYGYLKEIEKMGSAQGIMRVAHKNGNIKNWMFNNIVTDGPNGKYVIGTAVDITERVLLERELKESNSRFFKIFDKNPVSMVLANAANSKIEYVNEAFLETLGFTRDEVIGKISSEFNLITPEERAQTLLAVKEEGSIKHVERLIQKRNGEKIWMLNSLETVELNNSFFILSSLYNIDERKKMEEEMSRLAEFQKVMLDGTDYSIISTTEPEGIITSFNKGAEKMLGYKASEMIGRTPAILHDPIEVEERAKELSRELNINIQPGIDVFHMKSRTQNVSDSNEWTYIAKDGTRIPVELTITTLRATDKTILGYLGIAKDISASKKVKEALLLAKEKAEQAVIAKNSFLANMSHEIRTPMNAIIGYTELLTQSQLDADQREQVDSVRMAGQNLLSIINDILDFSKIESGKIALESVPFNLKETLKGIYNLLHVRAAEKNLNYHFFLDASLPDFVCGDSVRLNQILINLVGNAIKFTSKGHVTVSAKKIDEDKEYYRLYFVVQDSGLGIPADKIDLVFERFTQANTETTRKFGGTGLGLSIAKNLIELQGGKIHIKSELGEGSEFAFDILYKKADQADLEPLQKPFIPEKLLSSIRILLCEDNPLNQKLAKRVMDKFGFEVEIADNGLIGLEKLRKEKFDLVLMDLQMPEMDGYQTVQAIRQELQLKVPIIAMTAHSLVGEKEKCIEIGMNDYIGKPFTQEDLYNKICANLKVENENNVITQVNKAKQEVPKPLPFTVNLDSLKEFSGGNKEFEKELIELFLKQVPEDMQELETGFNDSNDFKIKTMAHKLKSSMLVIGLSGLNEHLDFIERNAEAKILRTESFEKYKMIKSILTENFEILKRKLVEEYNN